MTPKSFIIKKNTYKTEERHPDYKIIAKEEDGNGEVGWKEIGVCWRKTNDKGDVYLSCVESKPREKREEKKEEVKEDL